MRIFIVCFARNLVKILNAEFKKVEKEDEDSNVRKFRFHKLSILKNK